MKRMIGKCKKRNIVYETECLICKKESIEEEEMSRWNGMETKEGKGLKGAVPLVVSTERNGNGRNGKVIKNGTG